MISEKKLKSVFTLVAIILLLHTYSCSTTVTHVTDLGLSDEKYDRDFFQKENRTRLDRLVNSVKMLNSIAYYESFLLDKASKITYKQMGRTDFSSIALNKLYSTETASGTATIIYSDNGKVALLTCAHILNFPDTLFTFFKNSDGSNSIYLESISIKNRQTNLLPELTVSSEVDIIAIDSDADIALIGRDVTALNSRKFIPFNIIWGNSNELSWGSKVFIVGYPLNNKMITTGLVSPSQINSKDYFFVDAVFNRGFSGGVVIAVRDGAPNFELVGMVKSGTMHRNFNVIPDSNNPDFTFLPQVPYVGDLLVEEKAEIKYGVTKIMSIETIIDFLKNNESSLYELGYDTSKILN